MNKKKTIIAAVVLLLVLLVGGLIAYFTDTDQKENVFTIGNVDITLLEDNWDANDAKDLFPGNEVAKDPIIKNESTTNPAYVFAKVVAPCSDDVEENGVTTAGKELFPYELNDGWYLMSDTTCSDGSVTRIYAYGSDSAMTALDAGAKTPSLFKDGKVTVNTDLNGSEAGISGSKTITVTAYGIQTTGLSGNPASEYVTPNDVWNASNFSD